MVVAIRGMYGHGAALTIKAMVGEFTGYGLHTALGVRQISQLFHELSIEGEAVTNIVRRLNVSRARYWPGDVFCASTVLDIPPDAGPLRIWAKD